jgi:hypothetical protein
MRNNPAPARPIAAIQIEGGTGVGLGAAGETVIVKTAAPVIVGEPLLAITPRFASAGPPPTTVGTPASVAWQVKVNVPATVGVPAITPVVLPKFKPFGN